MARIEPGSIVERDGERRVVVDLVEDDDARLAVLRYTDNDHRREVDEDGGDIYLTAESAASLAVVGHIDD